MCFSIQKIFLSILTFVLFSVANFAQSNEDCLACHSDQDLSMEKKGKTFSLFVNEGILKKSVHKNLKCISCHAGFNADDIPHKEKIDPINCKSCHKDAGVKHQFHPQLLNSSGNETIPGLSCKNCHGTHEVSSPRQGQSKFNNTKVSLLCAKCHKDESDRFITSSHNLAIQKGVTGAPGCLDCHKSAITAKTLKNDSLKVKIAKEKLCLSCHLDDPEVRNRIPQSKAFIQAYEKSVHGKALSNGNYKAATCVDCHSSHDLQSGKLTTSSVYKTNIANTCSKCHYKIAEEYKESIHGKSLKAGKLDAPTCTDCHGEHNILKHDDPNSPVSFKNVSGQICTPCHASVRLSERYGLSSNRVQTFIESYHGLALRGGSANVANCGSCHGIHNIKPSSDSTSLIHKNNLAKTCGKCHPGANENFTKGKIHVDATDKQEPILYWISTLYIILIFSIIGGMLLHNILDLIKKAKIKLLIRRGVIRKEVHHSHRLYLRMTLSERIQHLSLLLSFFTLVITGFMLSFPDAWWVRHIREIIPGAFELRSYLHRIAAVVMIAASVYHVYYLSFTKRGRQLFIDLLPRLKDATDAIGVLKYNFGLSKEKPKFGRFSYIEKSEYWALVWGNIVMAATGFIMWFENTFIGIFTKLGWDVARTVHYYEAWLAFLAIVVWHIYFVIFNPDVYPMNLAWIKGTITEEEMEEEHPLELEEIKKQHSEDDHLNQE